MESRTRMLAGIIVVLVIVIGALGYYVMQMLPPGEGPITTASEASARISSLQSQLEVIASDLGDISEEL